MSDGTVASIHIAGAARGPLESVNAVRAVPGRGLEGDRYYFTAGSFSDKPGPDREVTLIESEAIEALRRDYKIEIRAGEARRNIVTRGVPLNHLVGREFRVGAVRMRGLRLCEPCGHLEKLTCPDVKRALAHRGGLRAQVLTEDTIRVGDVIEWV